jgi:hypothetical protein
MVYMVNGSKTLCHTYFHHYTVYIIHTVIILLEIQKPLLKQSVALDECHYCALGLVQKDKRRLSYHTIAPKNIN